MSLYSGFAEYYEQIFPFREEVYGFIRSCLPERTSLKVLDLGCGPGHYCGRFAADGDETTGLDLDREMIAEARSRYPDVEFHCLDMERAGSLGSGFHGMYCIGNVAAHLPADRFADLLARLSRMVEPGGTWIMQVVNWDRILHQGKQEFPAKPFSGPGNEFRRSYPKISEQQVTFRVELVLGGEVRFTEETTLHPVRSEHLVDMHREAGFRRTELFADFRGKPFDPEQAGGMILVARR
jgi:2-polyprenyl-3-methyl-5-hydroxy-6-metoxy-1,4-benzoquinol methylase